MAEAVEFVLDHGNFRVDMTGLKGLSPPLLINQQRNT